MKHNTLVPAITLNPCFEHFRFHLLCAKFETPPHRPSQRLRFRRNSQFFIEGAAGIFQREILRTLVETSKRCSRFPKEPFLMSSTKLGFHPTPEAFSGRGVVAFFVLQAVTQASVDFFVSRGGIHDFRK